MLNYKSLNKVNLQKIVHHTVKEYMIIIFYENFNFSYDENKIYVNNPALHTQIINFVKKRKKKQTRFKELNFFQFSEEAWVKKCKSKLKMH